MPLHVALTHRTSYRYDRPVGLGPQVIRLRPAPHSRTPVVSYALAVEPKPHFINWQHDPQGNFLARVVFPDKVTRFDVTVDLVADMATINPFDFFLEPDAETWPFAYDPVLTEELAPYRRPTPPGPLLNAFLAETPRDAQPTVSMLVALNRRIQQRVSYIVRMEPGVWTPEGVLGAGKGSCRDSAWLLVQVLRHLGVAARFVSGYLIQLAADVKPVDGPAGPEADFTDLHAWAEAYLPGAGWVGLDPTSGLMAGEGHIPLAATPEPSSAAPVSGAVERCETAFDVEMRVERVRETPRVTNPYAERQWRDILDAGRRVDARLAAGDVRLTMGGEPTFVCAADPDGAEWNTDALGPTKRAYAGRLIRRLAGLWASGAALQYARGKHYPGEQLPRWALHVHWRADGEAVWRDPALLASDDDRGDADAGTAARFCAALAERLQVDPGLILPAYEDVHYFLWRERRLPVNVVAEDARLHDPLERDRLARVFEQGLAASVGSVLPLRPVGLRRRNEGGSPEAMVVDGGARRWQSGRWHFRGGTLFLVPGDSPIGFRLPLDGLPWADPETVEHEVEPDPFAPRPGLPPRRAFERSRGDGTGNRVGNGAGGGSAHRGDDAGSEAFRPARQEAPVVGRGEPGLVRTALAVEARGRLLHVFFPPLHDAEDWLDLAAATEATAAEMGRKVVLEGYLPPKDPRLLGFSVTPDPGVIEVNVHPAANWAEHVERTEQLYEAARHEGLSAEKFMLDGRHIGTGGGNHAVLGAARAEDSPFLRRPDLLESLLGFWHNHPGLSYLFSGLFIGPSSQHPRTDEARQDNLAELEAAFSRIRPDKDVPPWLTNRPFRNILVDMTGNTHRTEFCIDEMYAPESASGRLGLVEFRTFEMAPHARMASAQTLLMRAAVAAFWHAPYERRLVRWGTRLHDEFMLPHFVEQDFADALQELRALGAPLQNEWFAPHLEFRFPRIGEVSFHGVALELRHALEPWPLLGEEPAGGGTVRYVDSSAERVQVRASGWVDERYVLACNGLAVPLTRTDAQGEYVGGVRFKAWAPPSALHPTVPTQSPLVFDVYDRWTGRSLGGMTHHIAHPGGRNYEYRPVNADEAEARRRIRFFPFGHTPGRMAEPRRAVSPESPRTLDLRKHGGPREHG